MASTADEQLPHTDVKIFLGACWEAARRIGGRVDELTFVGVSSFRAVTVTGRTGAHVVLCHTRLPMVAFTDTPPVSGQDLSGFVDPPPWADSFTAIGLRPLPVQELSTPMSEVDISELSEGELADIRYWRPDVLSDLLFNWWD